MEPLMSLVKTPDHRYAKYGALYRILARRRTSVRTPIGKLCRRSSCVMGTARMGDKQVFQARTAVAKAQEAIKERSFLLPERLLMFLPPADAIVELARGQT